MNDTLNTPAGEKARKKNLGRWGKGVRFLTSILDPRAYIQALKLVNYYNYSHVKPLRQLVKLGQLGTGAAISPNATFSNCERIEIGKGLHLGARCALWAGPGSGRILIGDDVLFGPDVMVTAANYRFNDGHPVTEQAMDEADVVIGNDVWLGTRAIVLPGSRIGDGAIIGAGAVVRGEIPPMGIAVGVPARVVAKRQIGHETEWKPKKVL